MSQPLLSVVIPSVNQPTLLHACLTSIFRHAEVPLQVIVVDDASSNRIISEVASKFPTVQILRRETPGGFCSAINTGLDAANTPFVQLLNDDTEVMPGWWREPLSMLQEQTHIGSIAPLVLRYADPGIIDSAGDEYHIGGWARNRFAGKSLQSVKLQTQAICTASACGAFYRLAALRSVGCFPTHFTAYFDDVEVGLRLREAGWQNWFSSQSTILHHGSASHGRKHSPARIEQISLNEERVFRDHAPATFTAWASHLFILLAKAGRRTLTGELAPFLKGRYRAWREGPSRRPLTPALAGDLYRRMLRTW